MPVAVDPALFSPGAISEETRAFNQQLETMLKDLPPNYTRDPKDIRADRESGKGIFGELQLAPEAQVRNIPGPAGDLPLRVFVPQKVDAVYLHVHGGGWVLGRAHHQDPRLVSISNGCNMAVVSVDYRLAPEDPYPAGNDDCEAAAAWVIEHAKTEFGTDRLLIGGESAGAHLAACTLLRMRDRHGYRGFAAANLVYGVYDVSGTPSALNWGPRELILSTPTIQWFFDLYEPHAARRRDPDISPLYADLSGMPPALFTVGTMDPLLDDSLFMSARWAAAGNEADLRVYPGGIHGFNALPSALGKQANEVIHAFLSKHARR